MGAGVVPGARWYGKRGEIPLTFEYPDRSGEIVDSSCGFEGGDDNDG